MKRKMWRWKRNWTHGALAGAAVFSSMGLVSAEEAEIIAPEVKPIAQEIVVTPTLQIGEDQFSKDLKLNVTIESPRAFVRGDGTLVEPIRFYLYNNYPSFISSYELKIYLGSDANRTKPVQVLAGVDPNGWLQWDGRLNDGTLVEGGKSYQAVLEVKGISGKKDIVYPLHFDVQKLTDKEVTKFEEETDPHELPGYGVDRTDHRGIMPKGSFGKAIIQGGRLQGATDITVNGMPLIADEQGRLVREIVLPPGTHEVVLGWTDETGQHHAKTESITIEKGSKKDFFFVAMLDLTWSKNKVTGAGKEILTEADPDHYDGTGNWDGRLVFYTKGDLNEKYRLTAHLDTTEERVENMFGHIGKKDPRRFTRELNPWDYYPIYGDGSTLESDVDTQGRFYVKLEKGKDHLMWGNYNTQMTGTEFGNFNRSLYGAQYYHESLNATEFGQPKSYLNIFAATSETRGSHNEFLSTGGSLYFLKHQRVTSGTLKITVEIRDENTGRVKSTSTLSEGTDYEIDSFQGRIMLTKALPMTANTSSSIIGGGDLLAGDEVWMVADYEYYSDGFDMDEQGSRGARGYRWLNDHFRLGGSYVYEEQEDGNAFKLMEMDLTWQPKAGTKTYLEYAQSDQSASDIFSSTDGGLRFNQVKFNDGETRKGKAWKVEQTIDFSEITGERNLPLWFNGYYSKKEKGFSSFADAQDRDMTEWGAELKYDFTEGKNGLRLKYTLEEEKGLYKEKIGGIQYYTEIKEGLRGAVEFQDRRETNYNSIGKGEETRESLLAVKLEKDFRQGKDKLYVIQQVTLDKKGDVDDNNKTTVGYETQIRKDIRIAGEVFGSNRGAGGGLAFNWDANDRASFYTKVMNDIDSDSGRGITTTVGGNWKANSQTELYSEKQFKSLHRERSTSDVYGVKYKPHENQYIEASYSQGTISHKNRDNNTLTRKSTTTDRSVWSLGYGYTGSDVEVRNKLEYRWETGANTIKQWVVTNRAKTKEHKGWSWLAQFDYAKTTGDSDVVNNFTEAAIGFAFRPINHDRLNLFGKVTFIQGMDPEDQFVAATDYYGNTSYYSDDYEQRSTVYSLEGIYELNPKWQVAFKAAHREGELRYRGEDDWYSSGASLLAGRVNYNINRFWEAQLEYRTLRVDTAKDNKNGWVTSLYRKLGNNAKVGVGYNWTDYNDDLTRLNYNSRGWFVNLVGKW